MVVKDSKPVHVGYINCSLFVLYENRSDTLISENV